MVVTGLIVLLYAKPFKIDNGPEGVSLEYLRADDDAPSNEGVKVIQQSVPIDVKSMLRTLPGLYQVEYALTEGKSGRGKTEMILKPKRLSFVGAWNPGAVAVDAAKRLQTAGTVPVGTAR